MGEKVSRNRTNDKKCLETGDTTIVCKKWVGTFFKKNWFYCDHNVITMCALLRIQGEHIYPNFYKK